MVCSGLSSLGEEIRCKRRDLDIAISKVIDCLSGPNAFSTYVLLLWERMAMIRTTVMRVEHWRAISVLIVINSITPSSSQTRYTTHKRHFSSSITLTMKQIASVAEVVHVPSSWL